MEHLLKEIAERRKAAEYDAAEIETLQAELEKTPEYQRLKLAKNSYKDFTADTETKITEAKEAALKDYKLTHKDPIAGFILRDKTVYTYTREAAETWAKENASFLFVFDEKSLQGAGQGQKQTTMRSGRQGTRDPTGLRPFRCTWWNYQEKQQETRSSKSRSSAKGRQHEEDMGKGQERIAAAKAPRVAGDTGSGYSFTCWTERPGRPARSPAGPTRMQQTSWRCHSARYETSARD